jgi:hypothetical protein
MLILSALILLLRLILKIKTFNLFFKLIDYKVRIVKEKVYEEYFIKERDDLADGLYFLQISSGTESYKQSIVID